ncbi:hypothetical protein COX09_01785 [Candidatus Beckwithbacteria bacterium CG23_combo_of_CG06-09_8_20_14_all_47_9]|uniref:Uncharacterized protein n=1 Tax=Candidatus Beckwithbacteria bacterium CG23_combo_of_CG06-09_8_20_14_all_47_9 TaxID=1974498 RepID=A0A2H0B403_9BACT|nr:MAG: hypothetical protein COX09_01785 [Candidatus Beckwithbacteria bacterium CG23_combo_of_CG06-09_8_20_14_all_47_9]
MASLIILLSLNTSLNCLTLNSLVPINSSVPILASAVIFLSTDKPISNFCCAVKLAIIVIGPVTSTLTLPKYFFEVINSETDFK